MKAISAGARRPEEYVNAASTANAMNSGRSCTNALSEPPMPTASSTAWMPTSCKAM